MERLMRRISTRSIPEPMIIFLTNYNISPLLGRLFPPSCSVLASRHHPRVTSALPAKGLSKAIEPLGLARLSQSRSRAVQLRNRLDSIRPPSDKHPVRHTMLANQAGQSM